MLKYRSVFRYLWLLLIAVAATFSSLSSTIYASPASSNQINTDSFALWRPALRTWLIPTEKFDDAKALAFDILTSEPKSAPYSTRLPSYGFSQDVLIARIDLKVAANVQQHTYILYIHYPLLDEVRLYQATKDAGLSEIFHTGDAFIAAKRPIRSRAFAFPVSIEPGTEQTFYFAARARDTLQMPISVFSPDQFEMHSQTEQYVFGAYFGGVIVMAFFMLTLYANFRDRTLVLMSVYLFCLAGVVGSVTGITSQLIFTDSPELAKQIRIVWLAVAMVCTLWFGMDYLESKKHFPGLHKIIVSVSVGCLIMPLLIPVIPFFYLIQLTLLLCVLVVVTVTAGSVIMLRKRYVPAIYYSIAWFWFFFGAIANVGRAFGYFPINFLTEYGFQWGSMVSVVCLALGMASRFSIDRENRQKAEKMAFEEKQDRLNAQIIVQQEQLKSRNAEAEAKAKGEFLANMSHEIRTPMNGVLGLAQLLKDTPLNPTQKNLLDTIENSGKTLLGVLNDVLDYSKIESGKFDIEEIPVFPAVLAMNTRELFVQRAREKGINIKCVVDPDVPEIIASDPTRISQILMNLTSNAFKFTHEGEIIIRVSKRGDKHLRFEVKDTGIGLSEEQKSRLFQSFSQADRSTTRKYGGTGLGLYISRRLADLMGGDIGVDSELNKGASFWFTVLINEATLAAQSHVAESKLTLDEKLKKIDLSSLNVLVAEDNRVNQMVIKGMLFKLGITPAIAENGAECVSRVVQTGGNFNCILMDCEMPEMDGYEATSRIREIAGIPQPVIVGVSANALKEQEEKAILAGMDDYLRKPIEFEQLLDKLEAARMRIEQADMRQQYPSTLSPKEQ